MFLFSLSTLIADSGKLRLRRRSLLSAVAAAAVLSCVVLLQRSKSTELMHIGALTAAMEVICPLQHVCSRREGCRLPLHAAALFLLLATAADTEFSSHDMPLITHSRDSDESDIFCVYTGSRWRIR
jgi:hypothetical protein